MKPGCECKSGLAEWCHAGDPCKGPGDLWRYYVDHCALPIRLCATCANRPFMADEIEPACETCRGTGHVPTKATVRDLGDPAFTLPEPTDCPKCDGTGEREL